MTQQERIARMQEIRLKFAENFVPPTSEERREFWRLAEECINETGECKLPDNYVELVNGIVPRRR